MMKKIFKNQLYHLLIYIFLGVILYLSVKNFPAHGKQLYGISVHTMILISWLSAGIHQFWILFFWRLELYTGKINRILGDTGFIIYRAGFILFGFIRFFMIITISFLTKDTIGIPYIFSIIFIITTGILAIWGFYSVIFYFGINRAFGADHFDPKYRKGTLEKRGLFKYIPNSMYSVVLLVLYQPGFLWSSKLGLILALINHILVWVHYFCTEKPDMKVIYSKTTK